MLKELTQLCIEDKFSKKNIREKILNDIRQGDDRFKSIYLNMITNIIQFLTADYYESKMNRLRRVKLQAQPNVIATEILISIMRLDGLGTIQQVSAQVCYGIGLGSDIFNDVRSCAELINCCSNLGLYNVRKANEELTMYIEPIYKLGDEAKLFIQETKYLPPMLCKPKKITKNTNSGYLSPIKDSIILGNSHHNKQLSLDVINLLNNIKFSLTDNINITENSKKPLDTIEKQRSFNDRRIQTEKVHQDLLDEGNEFYFTHKIDKRGRYYCQGYHVNYQGNSYRKSCLELANKEIIKGD